LQEEQRKGHRVVRSKNGKIHSFKKAVPKKALPKKGMKALIKKAVKKAVKKGESKKKKKKKHARPQHKKHKVQGKKKKKKSHPHMPPVPQHHKKKKHFLTLKKPLKPPHSGVKKRKADPKKGPWKDGNPNFSNDPPWKKGAPWGAGKKSKSATKSKAKATKKKKKKAAAELELTQSPLPPARISGELRRIDRAQKRAAVHRAERKKSKKTRRKLQLARLAARRARQKRANKRTRVRTLANIRALKAYCLSAKKYLDKSGYLANDTVRKGPLAQLILRFGNKNRKNLVSDYAHVMGKLKRDFRQFRGFLVRHLDQSVVYGTGAVTKRLISRGNEQLRANGGKDHLVIKFNSHQLGLLTEPTYFNKMAVPYKAYMKRHSKVIASSRHAGLKVTASLLRKQGAKARRIFYRRIHSHYIHKLASMRHRVEHAAYRAGMRKWHYGKKVMRVPTAALNGAQRYRDRNWRKVPSLNAQQKRARKMARAYMRHHGKLKMVDYIKRVERREESRMYPKPLPYDGYP